MPQNKQLEHLKRHWQWIQTLALLNNQIVSHRIFKMNYDLLSKSEGGSRDWVSKAEKQITAAFIGSPSSLQMLTLWKLLVYLLVTKEKRRCVLIELTKNEICIFFPNNYDRGLLINLWMCRLMGFADTVKVSVSRWKEIRHVWYEQKLLVTCCDHSKWQQQEKVW